MIPYLIFSFGAGLFMSYIWSSKDVANVMIKMLFSCWTVWTLLKLIAAVYPELPARI